MRELDKEIQHILGNRELVVSGPRFRALLHYLVEKNKMLTEAAMEQAIAENLPNPHKQFIDE